MELTFKDCCDISAALCRTADHNVWCPYCEWDGRGRHPKTCLWMRVNKEMMKQGRKESEGGDE